MKIEENLIAPHEKLRTQEAIQKVQGVLLIDLPTANRALSEIRQEMIDKGTGGDFFSCHYLIGMDGAVMRLIPEGEMGYLSYHDHINQSYIGIGAAYPVAPGDFMGSTVDTICSLVGFLLYKYTCTDFFYLQDILQGDQPRYLIEHPNQWAEMLERIEVKRQGLLYVENERAKGYEEKRKLHTDRILPSNNTP